MLYMQRVRNMMNNPASTNSVKQKDSEIEVQEGIDILFATMAVQEVRFFTAVAEILRQNGAKVGFLNFCEAGDAQFEKSGFPYLSLHREKRRWQGAILCPEQIVERYAIDLDSFIVHEKLTFNIKDRDALVRKTGLYLAMIEDFIARMRPSLVAQEIGGCIAPLSLFHATRRQGIDHLFFEPSILVERLFYILNVIDSRLGDCHPTKNDQKEVDAIIQTYRNPPTNIPFKDRHRFQDARLGKFINYNNVSRLISKVWHKYALRHEEEYSHIYNYCKRAGAMYWNRRQIGGLYRQPETLADLAPYFYYPFHVPVDFAITVRAPQYLDQLALVRDLANRLPKGFRLVIKEHPAAVGAYGRRQLQALLSDTRIILIPSGARSNEVAANSRGVITINSKVGIEAMFLSVPVICLGKAVYRGQGLTFDVNSLDQAEEVMRRQAEEGDPLDADEHNALLRRLVRRAVASSYPGELYKNDKATVATFAKSMTAFRSESFG